MSGWFTVDKAGLRRMTQGKISTIPWEMIQNGIDEATEVTVDIAPLMKDGKAVRNRIVLEVSDNKPGGYANLADAWTLFAPSTKADNASKRGYMNIGEKLVLGWTHSGYIETVSGSVTFHADGVRTENKRRKRAYGSYHRFILDVSQDRMREMIDAAQRIIVPPSITLTVNGEVVVPPPVVASTTAELMVLVAGADLMMRGRREETTLTLHEPDVYGAWVYVMGMPVMEIDLPWSVDVNKRLKQDVRRDQIFEGELQRIRVAVTDLMVECIDERDANTWARAALKDVQPETARTLVELRHGPDAVTYDAHDREANARAQSNDRTVIYGGSYSREEWAAIRRVQETDPTFAAPAGQLFPTLPSSVPAVDVPEREWTDDAVRVIDYARKAYRHLFGKELSAGIVANRDVTCCATMGWGRITFAVHKLPGDWDWFKPGNEDAQVALLLHEFGHDGHECHNHNEVWANNALDLAGRLLVWGVTP
jgi:hypothetical protein